MMSYNEWEKNKRNNLISIAVTIVLLAIIVVLVILLIKKQQNEPQPQPSASRDPSVSGTPEPSARETPTPSLQGTPPESAVPTAEPTPAAEYNYAQPVPQSRQVDLEYFKDAVFIGDSRMEDFAAFSGIAKYATFYTHIGMTVNHLITEVENKIIRFKINGENLTLEEAFRKYSDFSKVYIMLGYNELGWPYPEQFINYYVKVLNLIKSVRPDVKIYVECVIPVARQITGIGVDPKMENNQNIAVFNRYIQEMCEEQKVYYLNVQEALVDGEGYLPDGAASDGIHLKKEYCLKWLEYIRSHVV